ncbi:MAG: hypothetical protein COA90_06845 [Gammaproteobacteria bacterium]|nr:MAG: hypothetical protein COA90_06845 [Gammaproteobacteria bacterium]
MSDNQTKDAINSEHKLDELRRLILQTEQDEIVSLQHRLNDKETRSNELSGVLAAAVEKSAKQGDELSNALMPTVERAVKESVTKDIFIFADALYPVMGPAIRRSIIETFKEMLQSLNVALENSFSWQGLKWRLESLRTGQSFSEIVMLRSLVYRVEQVFLIHRESGILLNHVAESDDIQDADMVSGMLTAITDFVKDSFGLEDKSSLDSIKIDDLTVLIEQGPYATLAIVIRGSAPEGIRKGLRSVIESIHFEYRDLLLNFSGDSSLFDKTELSLASCLTSQVKQKQEGRFFSPQIIILCLLLLFIVAWFFNASYQHEAKWQQYIEQLRQEPGIAITHVSEQSGSFTITGLRDPLARTPQQIRTSLTPIAEEHIHYQLEPYQALLPAFILQRANKVLRPPSEISLTLNEGILTSAGSASKEWQQQARTLARTIAGVNSYNDLYVNNIDFSIFNAPETVILSFSDGTLTAIGSASYQWLLDTQSKVRLINSIKGYDDTQLINQDLVDLNAPETITLTLIDGLLIAEGKASHQWLVETKKESALISGIEEYDDTKVLDNDLHKMTSLIAQLEQKVILFDPYAYELTAVQLKEYMILERVKQLFSVTEILNQQAIIKITGHTDVSGDYDKNITLSKQRADFIYRYLTSQGIAEHKLTVDGVGSKFSSEDLQDEEKSLERSVTFTINTNHLKKGNLK